MIWKSGPGYMDPRNRLRPKWWISQFRVVWPLYKRGRKDNISFWYWAFRPFRNMSNTTVVSSKSIDPDR